MSEIFTNILTKIGQQKKAQAEANNTGLNITSFKIGDGNGAYYQPNENQTALVNVKYSGNFVAGTQSQILINPLNLNEVLYKCFIPADVGGFTIRELGLFDMDGNLILICKLPAQDKFALSSGLYQPLTFTPKIIYTNPQINAVLTPSSQIMPTTSQVINMITEYAPQVDLTAIYESLAQKADTDLENVSLFDVIDLGNITANFTLTKDRVHKGNITASCALNLPVVSTKYHNILFDFTLATGVSLTVPNNINWNYSMSPSLSNALVNRFIFDTKDGGITWKGYYSQFAGAL